MERETLDRIINIINYVDSSRELNKVCKLLGVLPLTEEEVRNVDDGKIEVIIDLFKRIIPKIEEKIKSEDEDYFYDRLDRGLISYIGNDKKKLEILETIPEEFRRAEIISSLDDDEKKIEFLNSILDEYNKAEIISSFKNDEKKLKFLGLISNETDKAVIISKLDDEAKKLELLSTISYDLARKDIIMSLREDENKIQFIDDISNEQFKYEIILSLNEDGNKLKFINSISSEWKIAEIIKSLKNEGKKLELLDTISGEYNKTIIISSLKNEEKKIEFLEIILNEHNKARIISSLKNDEIKMNFISTILDENNKARIIKSLKEEANMLELIETISSENLKAEIISLFSDDFLLKCFSNNELMEKHEILKKLKKLDDNVNKKEYDDLGENRKYDSFYLPKEMTIGAEIEAEGGWSDFFKRKDIINGWYIKSDGTLDQGVEAVSPIMHDLVEDVDGIYKITQIMKDFGFATSERCGGHVHIGVDFFNSVEGIKELLEIYGNSEEIFYLISNRPGELPRSGALDYAEPISAKIMKSTLDKSENDEFIRDAQRIQENRYSAINLMNINNGKNTIEFRLSNGTLDPDIWVENIRLYGRTVQMAHEISQINMKMKRGEVITEKEKTKLQMKAILKKEVSNDEKFEALMGLLFSEEERKTYEERYEVNRKLEKDEHVVEKMKFGLVDFKDIYENVEIPKDIIRNLSETERSEKGMFLYERDYYCRRE